VRLDQICGLLSLVFLITPYRGSPPDEIRRMADEWVRNPSIVHRAVKHQAEVNSGPKRGSSSSAVLCVLYTADRRGSDA
jgi:hypothetical protein